MSEPAKLPLSARKNIRDSEADRDKVLPEIKEIVGRELTFVPDFEKNHPLILASKGDNIGPIYHKTFLPAVRDALKKNLADPLFKEAFDQTVTKNEIRFRVGPVKRADTMDQSSYNDLFFEDGALVLVHTPEPCNIGDISNFNLSIVRGLHQSSPLPLHIRQNLKIHEKTKDDALEKISKATGQTWTLDNDAMVALWQEYGRQSGWDRYQKQFGGFWYKEALTNLATNIEKQCKDDMIKEGFNEKFTGHKIVFRYKKDAASYWVPAEEGGNLVVLFRDLCNFSNLSSDSDFAISKML